MANLNNKIAKATKWSSITEIIAKLVTPITSIILARLLTPEAFGVVTTLTMVISFAEIFTDAGFQKYLIQHEFKDETDKIQSTNVAFWSNLVMSLLFWFLISVFSEPLATLVGNPGLGNVLAIACVSIPLAAFSSIQMALYKRDLDFKTLFKVRVVSVLVPFLITIPLAFWFRNYWALILGTISTNLINAVLLTIYSKWKPSFYYSYSKFKEMFSFTIWSMFEAISIWLTSYVDVFIIGVYLTQHYLGLYKTSMVVVGQIMGLITAATTPVLFSSLSRLQSDEKEFNNIYFKFQKFVGLLVIPIGVGIYCFSDFITEILLGSQWLETSKFIGLWGLTSALTIVLSHYSSEVYRSKGKPKLSVLSQWLHIIVLWPTVLISIKYGYEVLYISRSFVRFEGIMVNLLLMYYLFQISPLRMLKNLKSPLIASLIMGFTAITLLSYNDSILGNILFIFICIILYFLIICMFKEERLLVMSFYKKILKKKA